MPEFFKTRRKLLAVIAAVLLLMIGVQLAKLLSRASESYASSSQFQDGEFVNSSVIPSPDLVRMAAKYWTDETVDQIPSKPILVNTLTASDIANLPDDQLHVVRFGHSTSLIKISGKLWLIDPVFSERVSPFSFMGPKRFHQPPISMIDLPPIDGVIISHNHYDHLDKQAIEQLRDKVAVFLVPLGIGQKMRKWGVATDKFFEFDWWQERNINGVSIIATPAQHFSGRGLFDRNATLWTSWVIKSSSNRVYYSGDSGYFDGFAEIGKRHGPFDVALLEVGAYDPMWPMVHMFPEQAIQANQDLRSQNLMPVHNGTFDLGFHSWYDPLEQISDLGVVNNINVLTPSVGQVLSIDKQQQVTPKTSQWWLN